MSDQTLQPMAISAPLGEGFQQTNALALHDFDGDGDEEIVVAKTDHHRGALEVWDYHGPGEDGFEPLWISGPLEERPFFSTTVADLDGDSASEILASSQYALSSYDWLTRTLKWRYEKTEYPFPYFVDVQFLADGKKGGHALVLSYLDGVLIFDAEGTVVHTVPGPIVAYAARRHGKTIEMLTAESGGRGAGGRVCSLSVRLAPIASTSTKRCVDLSYLDRRDRVRRRRPVLAHRRRASSSLPLGGRPGVERFREVWSAGADLPTGSDPSGR